MEITTAYSGYEDSEPVASVSKLAAPPHYSVNGKEIAVGASRLERLSCGIDRLLTAVGRLP